MHTNLHVRGVSEQRRRAAKRFNGAKQMAVLVADRADTLRVFVEADVLAARRAAEGREKVASVCRREARGAGILAGDQQGLCGCDQVLALGARDLEVMQLVKKVAQTLPMAYTVSDDKLVINVGSPSIKETTHEAASVVLGAVEISRGRVSAIVFAFGEFGRRRQTLQVGAVATLVVPGASGDARKKELGVARAVEAAPADKGLSLGHDRRGGRRGRRGLARGIARACNAVELEERLVARHRRRR